jgi:hypothetical protein
MTGATVKKRPNLIIWMGVTIAPMFLAADLIPVAFTPIDYLNMPYSRILWCMPFALIPVGFVFAITFNRSKTIAGVTLMLVMCSIIAIASWARAQPIKIHVTRMVDSYEIDAWQKTLDFKVWQQADRTGAEFWVDRTPGRAEQVTREVRRMGIWRS